MKLYCNLHSTCSRKVLATLAEKNAEAEIIPIDLFKLEQKEPAYLARHPFGVVPVLDDDGFVLYESRAIIRYLDEKLPGIALTPKNPRDRARMEQWFSIEHSYFSTAAMKIVRERLFAPRRGQTPDQAVVDAQIPSLSLALDVTEKRLTEQPYLAGDMFSLAEINFMPYLEYLSATPEASHIASHPHVAAWWKKISERPSWKKTVGK